MPEAPLHKTKRKKNLALMALVLAWCALIFVITMVKIAHAQDTAQSYSGGRARHQAAIEQTQQKLQDDGQSYVEQQQEIDNLRQNRRATYQQELDARPAQWQDGWQGRLYNQD